MQVFHESSAIVGISELRLKLKEILNLAKKVTVFLGKRQKPVAVLIPVTEYRVMEDLLERVEDAVLGYIALERDKKTDLKEYIDLTELEKKVGLRKK